jgi:hypothetical protein
MPMFDNLYVAQSLIEKAIEGTDIVLKPCEGYYDFQTKDLDNSLTSFYIKEDGYFFWEKIEYEWVEPDPSSDKKWNFGYQKQIGDPELTEDKRSSYIDFYDFFYTEKERVFVTFTAHVKNGKLAEEIKIKNIERDDLEEEAIKHKKNRAEWNIICSRWEWKLATFIFSFKNKMRKIVYPLKKGLEDLEYYLREKAKRDTSL